MLKKLLICSALLIASTVGAAVKENGIAALNVEKVRMETKAGKSILQQINELEVKLQDKSNKMQKEFDRLKQDLDKQRAVLSKEAFAKKEADFNNKFVEARKEMQKEVSIIEQAQQKALAEFDTVAYEVIKVIIKEEGYLQIIHHNVLIYTDPKSDITSQVIAAMDKKIDNITLKLESK